MAIKVNGTTVIDDSRNLSNVGGLKTVAGNNLVGSGDIGLKTVNGSSIVGSGDLAISSADVAAQVYTYRAYRSGEPTHYPGFTNGKHMSGVAGQSGGGHGSFSNGSYAHGTNYSGQTYWSIAVRTS